MMLCERRPRFDRLRKNRRRAERSGYPESDEMTIYQPETEQQTFYAAVTDPHRGEDRRASLKAAVIRELEQGVRRKNVIRSLDALADELGERGDHDAEDAVLDIMDAMHGWVHPSKRF
jgi:hypothetical protein